MRLFCFLAFIGVFLTRNVILSLHREHPTHLEWLFGLTDKSNETKKKEDSPNVCKTQECEKIAKELASNIDKSVDPCNDFYEYACGKWPEHNPIPEGLTSWSLFQSAQKKVDDRVQEILDAGPQDNDVLGVRLAKKWYSVCMDTDTMEKQGIEPIVYTLARIGGWPMIMDPDEWDEREYNWQKVDDQYMRLTGRNTFHDVRVYDESFNDSSKVIRIDTPHLPPGALQLWIGGLEDSEEDNEDPSDEDPSDENKQSDEDNENPGSEGSEDEDDNDEKAKKKIEKEKTSNRISHKKSRKVEHDGKKKINSRVSIKQETGSKGSEDNCCDDDDDDDDDNDDDDDDDDYDDDDDEDDDDDDDDEDENAKKKISTKKNRIARKKNRKSEHSGKKKNNVRSSIKHNSHKMKKQRTKRQVNMAKAFNKLARINHRGVLRARLNKKNRVNKNRKEGSKETSDEQTKATTSAPQVTTTEETSEEINWNTRENYATYISKVARALAKARRTGVPEDHIDKDIEDMIDFQIKLTELSMESGDEIEMRLDDFQNRYNEKNHKTDHSKINWMYKIAELFDEASVSVDGDLDIELDSPDYFEGLISLLDETPSRVIVNYIHWNFVSQAIRTTTREMRKLYNEWEDEEVEDEKTEKKIRSSECKWEIEEMRDILAYEYVRKHFSDNITQTAQDMVDDIQKEVEYQIKESDWMDEDTKDYVLTKLLNMKKYIGYPEWYKNNTIIKRYFQGLIICNSYYENALSYSRYHKWKNLREYIKDVNDDEGIWWMSPLTVNALFDPMENSITIMAADFQSPFFAYGQPQAINYGIIGVIMGHEVNHGFDNNGIFINKNGKFVEWLSAMADAYGKRAECFVNQFNNYEIEEGTKIDDYGNQTAGENIADTMGLIAAYRAYLRRERECERSDTVLPGLEDITNNQLFFLSFANVWCEVDENIRVSSMFDDHSTGRLRVIGTLSNSDDFAKAFNCPVGSAMNPEKKCNIWK